MPQSQADFFAAVDPVVNRAFYGLESEVEKQAFDIFKTDTDDEPIKSAVEYAGPPNLQLKTENAAVLQRTIKQGPIKTWRAVLHAAALTLSYEAASDTTNRYGKITQSAGAMGRAVNITPELICALFLDRAFDSAFPEIADGIELCSTVHQLPDGVTTFSTAMASPVALDETSAEDIETALRNIPGPDGNIMPQTVKGWIVPSALFNKATKLSRNTQTSGSANNDPSVINGTRVLPLDYLGSNTRYFAQTKNPRGLFWDWIKKPQFITDQVVLMLQKVYVAWFRSRIGCQDPRGIYGVNAA